MLLFLFLNNAHIRKNKHTHILAHFTHNICIFVKYWRITDFDGNILNVIPYTSSVKIFKLKFKLDLELVLWSVVDFGWALQVLTSLTTA